MVLIPLFAQSTIEKDSLNLSKKITKNNLTNSKVIEADSIITPKKKGFSFKSIGNFFTSLFKKKKDTIAPNTAKIDSLQTKVILNDSITPQTKKFSFKTIGNFFSSIFKKKKENKKG